jgi:hypothetical protein
VTLDAGAWIQAVPGVGTIAGGGSQIITVQSSEVGLASGVYNGQIALQVESSATVSAARLLPGYTAIYQVQITVPDGLASGAAGGFRVWAGGAL